MKERDKNKTINKYIAPINEAELICRMIEAGAGIKRPKGVSAEDALKSLDAEDKLIWRNAATAAMNYWRECIDNINTVH